MTSATICLDKKTYPMMMHLSIIPQHEISSEQPTYDPATQSSNFSSAMAGSWCTRSASTGFWLTPGSRDDDSQEDD
ncbi:hypothetical protein [Chamaesiphon sp. VAR_48_metabat_135_sub]|uniref:hypothetical protein n=1 Tax=Chamaesiphon sp. VAR_48_metabat_135_sub TaxID=2964699 RepID=UPI00286C66F1|nr:hypothetical protein [Chamaesiphon sp. VAR_48_metabat_135_sub]